ncbi:AMIN-like domain-containing (lipo)protein [Streptomyces sp. S1]|uniref:AMIN-like domain-containing (lipo)protein n=1 Tax=Streptomyces sp. S1 TaxID=718288 RepID=UPI003D73DB52
MRFARRAPLRVLAPLATAALLALPVSPVASAAEARTAASCGDICVLGVRAATHSDRDRDVLGLGEGILPEVSPRTNTTGVYYTPADATRYVTTCGTSCLFITHFHNSAGQSTCKSPDVQPCDLSEVKGVQAVGGFEGRAEFALSPGPSTRYPVVTLKRPNRVVIDAYR